MAEERLVAGLTCSQVLANLSDFVDGSLDAKQAEMIEAHLRGCDWCERFGAGFSAVVKELRRQLREPDPVEPEVSERLWSRLGPGTIGT